MFFMQPKHAQREHVFYCIRKYGYYSGCRKHWPVLLLSCSSQRHVRVHFNKDRGDQCRKLSCQMIEETVLSIKDIPLVLKQVWKQDNTIESMKVAEVGSNTDNV